MAIVFISLNVCFIAFLGSLNVCSSCFIDGACVVPDYMYNNLGYQSRAYITIDTHTRHVNVDMCISTLLNEVSTVIHALN